MDGCFMMLLSMPTDINYWLMKCVLEADFSDLDCRIFAQILRKTFSGLNFESTRLMKCDRYNMIQYEDTYNWGYS